jgi:hypothetical protein
MVRYQLLDLIQRSTLDRGSPNTQTTRSESEGQHLINEMLRAGFDPNHWHMDQRPRSLHEGCTLTLKHYCLIRIEWPDPHLPALAGLWRRSGGTVAGTHRRHTHMHPDGLFPTLVGPTQGVRKGEELGTMLTTN